jgi:UDP-N-acetylmuramoylalanine--D-glutamate ligase
MRYAFDLRSNRMPHQADEKTGKAAGTWARFFKDKTVTLMGLGLLGRGVGDAAFLARHCKKVFVTDAKSAEELRVSLDALRDFNNIDFVLGGHDEKNFSGVDFVVKGAGVRLDNPYIAHARKNGVPVYMSTALFAHLSPLRLIGVTGTRGKTTTACMIAEALKQAGEKVLLGGNIRGVSTLAFLPEAHVYDLAVLELDSWQLQGFDDLKISPAIGVFTTFYPDHMNYYDGDMDRYWQDKAAIFRHQKPGDALALSAQVEAIAAAKNEPRAGRWIVAQPLPPAFAMKIPGPHNRLNAGLAKAALTLAGLDETTADKALHGFSGVEGRLQFVGAWEGRAIYNDNNATTQEATLAALASFPPHATVLIFGGADKGLPIGGMLDYIVANDIRCVAIKGTGSDRVLQTLPQTGVAATMQEAVRMAAELSKPGDTIILSPAFASFGVFKNEYDRNDQFMAEARKLMNGTP